MDPFLGQIVLFGGNFAPRNWMYCNGQLLQIQQNAALYSLLGVYYGGDGRVTFALPDLRGRTPIGAGHGIGLSNRPIGQSAGSMTNYILAANMPAHNHTASLHVNSANATQSAATANSTIATPGTLSGRTFTPSEGFNTATPNTNLNTGSVTTDFTGGGLPVNNMQPNLAINYIICVDGYYPSRN